MEQTKEQKTNKALNFMLACLAMSIVLTVADLVKSELRGNNVQGKCELIKTEPNVVKGTQDITWVCTTKLDKQ